MNKAILLLEDGTTYYGKYFTEPGEVAGEVVFNTSMTGYQEVLTDPSYKGQIVVMTYPQIGNYGINLSDNESATIQVEGFVVREYSKFYDNWRAKYSLLEFLNEKKILGIEEVDTRSLVRHIRLFGAMKGIISCYDFDKASLKKKLDNVPSIVGRDLVKEVTCKEKYIWQMQQDEKYNLINRIIVMDFGVKYNILRSIAKYVKEVIVVPANTEYNQILDLSPDGIILSNGPGDPVGVSYVLPTIRKLIEAKVPMFGICLGHQLISLALGGKTYKLKFGHRGINQPVKNLLTGKIEITAQNHGFCVDIASISNIAEVTHINLNDNTLEGVKYKDLPVFSVQYHPEASPGPHDASYLFEEFVRLIKNYSKNQTRKKKKNLLNDKNILWKMKK